MTTLADLSTERAIATVWRCPPERDETFCRTDLTVRTESDRSVSDASRSISPSSKVPQLGLFAAEEHVLHDVEVVAQREVLVHDLDAEVRRLARVVEVHDLAVELHLALVVGLHAGEALDQGRLAGAVVADERGDLAGVGLEDTPLRTLTGPKLFLTSVSSMMGKSMPGSFLSGTTVSGRACG